MDEVKGGNITPILKSFGGHNGGMLTLKMECIIELKVADCGGDLLMMLPTQYV